MADGKTDCYKKTIFFLSVLLIIFGFALVVLGGIGTQHLKEETQFNDIINPYILIGIGCAILVSCLVCWGGLYFDSPCMLRTVGVALVVVLIALVASGIWVKLNYDSLNDPSGKLNIKLKDHLMEKLNNFSSDNTTRDYWNNLQTEEKCCGVTTPEDWKSVDIVNRTKYYYFKNSSDKKLPQHCCTHTTADTEYCEYHPTGCMHVVIDFFNSVIMGVSSGVCVLLFCIALIEAILVFLLATRLGNQPQSYSQAEQNEC